MPVAIELLKQFPFFKGVSDHNLMILAQATNLGTAKQGQEILSRGAIVSYLTFILLGRIQSSEIADDGRIIGVNTLVPGDIIGFITLIDNHPSTNVLKTLEDSQLLLVPMVAARQLIKTEPIVGERVMILLAQSLRMSTKQRAMLSLPNAFHRIFAQLNLLINNPVATRQVQQIPPQQDIAVMVNTSRETVSRALNMLIKEGVLTKTGHQFKIKRCETLNKLAIDGLDAIQDAADPLK
jgi:CRP/FNR family cyclic AMP-dependent transcriptional regulator